MKQLANTSSFYCTCCGNKGIPIARWRGAERNAGHLKKIYCLKCKKEVNHVECKMFSKYDYEDFLLEFNYKLLYEGKLLYRIIISFLFAIFISLLYFVILLKINSGILHIYFFLSIFTGYLSSFLIYNKLIVKNKKV